MRQGYSRVDGASAAMTPTDKDEKRRRSQLASIHILLKQTGMTDQAYRDMLDRLTRRRSAGLLGESDRLLVITELRSLIPTDPKMKKIIALLRDQGRSLAYAEGISKNMFRLPLTDLNSRQLRSVIAALNYDLNRKKSRGA